MRAERSRALQGQNPNANKAKVSMLVLVKAQKKVRNVFVAPVAMAA